MTREEAKKLWDERVPKERDEDGWFQPDEIYYRDLTMGFFLALGFSPKEAHELDNELFKEGKS